MSEMPREKALEFQVYALALTRGSEPKHVIELIKHLIALSGDAEAKHAMQRSKACHRAN
jgi:hypothetical protein